MDSIKRLSYKLFLMGLMLFNQACSQMGIGSIPVNDTVGQSELSSTESNVTQNPYSLLSAEQVLKGFSSVTGVAVNSNGVLNEYNTRRSILASNFSLNLVTSPMLVAITNLGSQFCLNLVNQEAAIATLENRKFFRSINFRTAPTSVTDANMAEAVTIMAGHFWGRSPASAEVAMIMQGKNEFVSALTDAQKAQAASTVNLMMFTCTAMIASFDTITL